MNMNYCMFENTFHDLEQCHEKLLELGNFDEIKEELSETEFKYFERMLELCERITDFKK